jgi:two-component system alkaline phosphatase synthesis response regulator PhoP
MAGEIILLVDDEENIIQLARLYLEREGYKIVAVSDGQAALEKIQSVHPALVVLDIMLPVLDGLEVCKRVRAEKNPVAILMLTARDDDIDKIIGLEMGADDYMTKPFNPRELVARVRAILRRGDRLSAQPMEEAIMIGDLWIDSARREVTCQGQMLDLRTQEFEVLLVLARSRGLVLNREQLLNQAWGFDFYGQTRTVDVHIAQLRRKLAASRVKIETVTGIGYKLVA